MNKSKKRTNVFVFNQFANLLKTIPYNKISVSDIIKVAIINRNTFYLHFKNKLDLLSKSFTYFFNKENIDQKAPMGLFIKSLKQRPFYTLNNFYKKFYPTYYHSQINDKQFNVVIYRIFKKYLISKTKGKIIWSLSRIDAVIVWNRYQNNHFDILSNDYKSASSDPSKLDKIYQTKKFPKISNN